MADLTLISWNCQGLRVNSPSTFQKMFFLASQYPQHQFDILALLETHHASEADFPPIFKEYNVNHHIIHTPAPSSDAFSGIIVVLNKEFTVLSTDTLLPGRIITVKFQYHITHEEYLLTVYYGIQVVKPSNAQIDVIFKSLVTDHATHTNSFILGDFNFVDNDLDRTNGMHCHDKRATKLWTPHKTQLLLTDPFRHLYPKRRLYSYRATNGKTNSRIDRLYVSEHNIRNVHKYLYIPTPFLDHKIQEVRYKTGLRSGHGNLENECVCFTRSPLPECHSHTP